MDGGGRLPHAAFHVEHGDFLHGGLTLQIVRATSDTRGNRPDISPERQGRQGARARDSVVRRHWHCDRVGLTPSIARAQTPPVPAQTPRSLPRSRPAQPAPAQPAKPPEPPHILSGTLTVGISLESGQTDLNATQFMMQGQRPYSRNGTFTMKGGYTRATTKPPAARPRFKVADRLEGERRHRGELRQAVAS